jgi:6-pyruvoyltetrahydropterin/6-carboxytetrahydropterin synthase
MYYLKKKLEIAGAHCLELNYESKCSNIHGHNWQIFIYCKSEKLDENGMVIDFVKIKEEVMKLDHKNLNEILDFNPTAENIAKYLCKNIPKCYKVDVIESENNEVSYVQD